MTYRQGETPIVCGQFIIRKLLTSRLRPKN
jgi:hypothetical protein